MKTRCFVSILIFACQILCCASAIAFLMRDNSIVISDSSISREDREPIRVAEKFLAALATGNEQKANSYLTISTQAAVLQYCKDGKVTLCLDDLGRQSWGDFEGILGYYAKPSTGAIGFDIKWSRTTHFVVILVVLENEQWAVSGWRGFVSSETSGLISGVNQTNAFPPND